MVGNVQTSWIDNIYRMAPIIDMHALSVNVIYWGYAKHHPDNQLHRHSFYEACYVANRTGRFFCEGKWHPVGPGDIFLARPGVNHQILSNIDGDMELYWIAFDWKMGSNQAQSDVARLFLEASTSCVVLSHDDGRVFGAWKVLQTIGQALDPGAAIQVHGLAASIITGIFQQLVGPNQVNPLSGRDTFVESTLIRQAVLYIRDNLTRPLTLSEVSQYVNLSYRHFSRLFSKHMGCSFVQYVNQARLESAAALLRDRNRSVQEVAEATGYLDVQYFTRLFTRFIGVSPAKYRSQSTHYARPSRTPGEYV